MALELAEIPCQTCGALHKPKRHKQRFCSRPCFRAAWRKANPDIRVRPPRYRVRRGNCLGCGCAYEVRTQHSGSEDTGRYCARECYNATKAKVAAEREALARMREAWAWRPSALVLAEVSALRRIAKYVENPRLTIRPCRSCSVPTVGKKGYRRLCQPCRAQAIREMRQSESAKAAKRVYKSRRRAVEIGLSAGRIDPLAVFDRDGWRCYLCGVETPRSLRGSYEPQAPELEHVIPLVCGGTHTWGNVKCSCRACNGRKGAAMPTGGVQQLGAIRR